MSEKSDASSPDYEQDWDTLEQQSMEVLERSCEKLKEDPSGSAAASSRATAASSIGPTALPEHMRLMQEACSREPYRPEDHQFTSEEMWAGFSSEEDEEDQKQAVLGLLQSQVEGEDAFFPFLS
eukprot:symbB.v1.2.040076.t1/scaffold6972.1/size14117/2